MNFEHSWGDGVAVLRFFQDIYKDAANHPHVHPGSEKSLMDTSAHVRKLGKFVCLVVNILTPDNLMLNVFFFLFLLEFTLDDKAKQNILMAKEKYNAFTKSLAFSFFEFPEFGRNLCKEAQVSPDAVMQLGFQVRFSVHSTVLL